MGKVDIKQATKTNWVTDATNQSGYPGHENIKLGCLQRIADATEAMAANFIKLQNDVDYYKRRYTEESEAGQRLARRNAALRGVINRMKKKK